MILQVEGPGFGHWIGQNPALSTKCPLPVIAHEVGQYSIFPTLEEFATCTGNLVPDNVLGPLRKSIEFWGKDLACKFKQASIEFQHILYKEEIEAVLRTDEQAGFHLLGFMDYPGYGTAICGITNLGLRPRLRQSSEYFSSFCAPIVPLLVRKEYGEIMKYLRPTLKRPITVFVTWNPRRLSGG